MVDELYIVFDLVRQLNRHSVWRVEENLKIVRAILVVRSNPELALLMDGVGESIPGNSDKIGVQQFWPILLERSLETIPGVQVIANDGRLALVRERPGSLKPHWFDMHRDLSCHGMR
ncbi:MAG: hypothetical protein ABSF28_18425 [Terracidiphilus sp.]|jgi:hypothetical protein